MGYEAILLPKFCDVVLAARKAGALGENLKMLQLAEVCEILTRSLAKIGIIALIDEATGYQYDREAQELQKIFKLYISEELHSWQKRFPDIFYQEIFRLNGWPYTVDDIKQRPGVIGTWTNQLIYDKLPKGALKELKSRTPKSSKGKRKHRFHQLLTLDIGQPDLQRQLTSVITIMRLSSDWKDFLVKFNQLYGQISIEFPKPEPKAGAKPIKKKPMTKLNKALKKALNYNPKEKDKNQK